MKHFFKLIKIRFKALNKSVVSLFILSIISVICTELYLNNVPSYNNLQFKIGTIYIKLCYSYVSAFLFYYLIVFLPKEKKKISGYVHINNKIMFIDKLLGQMIYIAVYQDEAADNLKKHNGKFDKGDIDLYLSKNYPPTGKNNGRTFSNLKLNKNTLKNLNAIINKTIIYIDNVLLLNDLIDNEVLFYLLSIKEKLENIIDIKYYSVADNSMPEMFLTLWDINQINYLKGKIVDTFTNKMINIYKYEAKRIGKELDKNISSY